MAPMLHPTVATTSSRALLSACDQLGLDRQVLLAAAGLTASDGGSDSRHGSSAASQRNICQPRRAVGWIVMHDRTCPVIGAAGGIGRSLVDLLHREGGRWYSLAAPRTR